MKILFFGLGSIGQRHAKLLKENFEHQLFAFRSRPENIGNDLGITEVHSWQEVEALQPDVAFITNPTSKHVETAIKCANLGMHLFIEKPLSDSLKDVVELENICQEKGLKIYIAYCLRFHPVIMKMRELLNGKQVYHVRVVCSSYLPDWRRGRDSKKVYSAQTSLGGGVLLDLSHEFDYIQYLFGPISEMQGQFGRASDVTVDAEDYADVLIRTENSVPANLHLNFMSCNLERSIRVDLKDGFLVGDLINSRLEYSDRGKNESWQFSSDRNEYLKQQLEYFFSNLGRPTMMNDLQEAKPLLNKILEFKNGSK